MGTIFTASSTSTKDTMAGERPRCPAQRGPPAPLLNRVAKEASDLPGVQAGRGRGRRERQMARQQSWERGEVGGAVLSWLNQGPVAAHKWTLPPCRALPPRHM